MPGWTTRKHGHHRLALVALAKNDASAIEDARFAPVGILLQIEFPAHRIKGYVELLEYALPDVARKSAPAVSPLARYATTSWTSASPSLSDRTRA